MNPEPLDEPVASEMPFERRRVDVLGSSMSYVDEGTGRPILLLHGNPTHLYIWRNIIPYLSPLGRVVAVDLIGMGESDKPNIAYRFEDHARYLEHFLAAVGIDEDLVLVLHDWGSGLGFDLAAQHPEKIAAVAFMESQAAPVFPTTFSAIPDEQVGLFQTLRDPVKGAELVESHNIFIEEFLPRTTLRTLSQAAHDEYRRPFIDPAYRRPMVMWPRELAIDGQPADVAARAERWNDWLASSDTPKLALYAEPGAFMPREAVEKMQGTFPNLSTQSIGPGLHFVQESQPDAIGLAIATWLRSLS